MTVHTEFEDLLRETAPQVLGVLVRRYGDFDAAEDAVQDALLAAFTHWPRDGVPRNVRAWLIQTTSRRLIDQWRSDESRRQREALAARHETADTDVPDRDDTLALMFMCCHPAFNPAAAIPLTLRAIGGLTTAEIARAFLVNDKTMAQRISRAKQQIQASGARFGMPSPDEQTSRLPMVLHTLYLIFNEGCASSVSTQRPGSGPGQARPLARSRSCALAAKPGGVMASVRLRERCAVLSRSRDELSRNGVVPCGGQYYTARMATLTVRTDADTDRALKDLTADGTSQSEVIRQAIYRAWRERRHARMEKESQQLLDDPEEQAEMKAIRADLDAISAW